MTRIRTLSGLAILTAAAATLPARADAPPTTRPAAPAADVYVLPFRPLTDAPGLAWAGPAVRQNLTSDLARAAFRPLAGDAAPDPLAAARAAGARYLVTGSYQSVDGRLRFDGQLTDVATAAALAGLSATGDGRDLFALEDALSAQLVHALTRSTARPSVTARPVPPDLQPAALAAAVQPPAAAPGSAYQGSALQSYVDANRTPSVDYDRQLDDARDRNTFGSYTTSAFGGGFGYGGYGYGGSGLFGGGYLAGVSYPIAGGIAGNVGYGGFGGGGFGPGVGGIGRGSFGGRGGFR